MDKEGVSQTNLSKVRQNQVASTL